MGPCLPGDGAGKRHPAVPRPVASGRHGEGPARRSARRTMTDTLPRRSRRSVLDIAWRAVLVAVVLAGTGLALKALDPAADEEVSRWAAGTGGRAGDVVSLALSRIGDVPGVVVALAVALVVARRRHRWRDLSLVAVAGTIELLVFLVVSEVVRRDRPPVPSPDAMPFTGAFPSGHTAVALAVLGALALLIPPDRPRLRGGLLATAGVVAVLVGASRVVRGQHRPSEVLAGLALGTAAVVVAHRVGRLRGWAPDGDDESGAGGRPAAVGVGRSSGPRAGGPPAPTREPAPLRDV